MTTVTGLNGTVSFDGRTVTIARDQARYRDHGAGPRRLPLRSLTSVELKPAGLFTNGFIQFSTGDEPGGHGGLGRSVRAAGDELSILFNRGQQKDFDALLGEIEQAMNPGSA